MWEICITRFSIHSYKISRVFFLPYQPSRHLARLTLQQQPLRAVHLRTTVCRLARAQLRNTKLDISTSNMSTQPSSSSAATTDIVMKWFPHLQMSRMIWWIWQTAIRYLVDDLVKSIKNQATQCKYEYQKPIVPKKANKFNIIFIINTTHCLWFILFLKNSS